MSISQRQALATGVAWLDEAEAQLAEAAEHRATANEALS